MLIMRGLIILKQPSFLVVIVITNWDLKIYLLLTCRIILNLNLHLNVMIVAKNLIGKCNMIGT